MTHLNGTQQSLLLLLLFLLFTSQNVPQEPITLPLHLTVRSDLVLYEVGHWKVDAAKTRKMKSCLTFFFRQKLLNKQVKLCCIHLQGRCLDIADVSMRTGTHWVDALKASPHVDTSCALTTVVLLA